MLARADLPGGASPATLQVTTRVQCVNVNDGIGAGGSAFLRILRVRLLFVRTCNTERKKECFDDGAVIRTGVISIPLQYYEQVFPYRNPAQHWISCVLFSLSPNGFVLLLCGRSDFSFPHLLSFCHPPLVVLSLPIYNIQIRARLVRCVAHLFFFSRRLSVLRHAPLVRFYVTKVSSYHSTVHANYLPPLTLSLLRRLL